MNADGAWSRAVLPALGLVLVQGCSDPNDGPKRRGAGTSSGAVSKYDAEHPDFRMHPDALIVQQEDFALVYDVTVKEKSLVLPTAGHQALLDQIIVGKTILVSRSNDENFLKNPGFIRLVTSKQAVGDETTLETKTLSAFDIVRGSLSPANGHPVGVRVKKGVAPQATGLRLQRKFGDLEPMDLPDIINKEFDEDYGKTFTEKKGETEVSYKTPDGVTHKETKKWLGDVSSKLQVKGHVYLSPIVQFFVDIDWDDNPWGGIGVWVSRFRTEVGLSYEIEGSLDFQLRGGVSGKVELEGLADEKDLLPGCTIWGIPCGIQIRSAFTCDADLQGAVTYKTTTPGKVFGNPSFGVDYNEGEDPKVFAGELFQKQLPVFDTTASDAAGSATGFQGATKIAMRASGSAGCKYQSTLDFYVGDGFDWHALSAEAKAGAGVGLTAEVRAAAVGCATYNFLTNSWQNASFGAGFRGVLTPVANVFAYARGNVLWKDFSFGSEAGWPIYKGDPINFIDAKVGSIDPFSPPAGCAAP